MEKLDAHEAWIDASLQLLPATQLDLPVLRVIERLPFLVLVAELEEIVEEEVALLAREPRTS